MARTIKDAKLDTRAARAKLAARGPAYFRAVEPGLHLGYRKTAGRNGQAIAGTWIARLYAGEKSYRHERIGIADDFSDADGKAILSFKQALDSARAMMVREAHGDDGAGEADEPAATVAAAMETYLAHLKTNGRTADAIRDAKYRIDAFVLPKLGAIKLADLTSARLKGWRDDMVKHAPRLRTRKGETQKHRDMAEDDDGRRRRASVNRIWSTLRAGLNLAFQNGKVPTDAAWRKVKPFRGVDSARVRYLSIVESNRLINAAEPDFRLVLQGALLTGARYGQLANAIVADFDADGETLRLSTRKGDGTVKTFHIHLTDDAVEFLKGLVAGHSSAERIFRKADGEPWNKSNQLRPIADASEHAGIEPPANFHVTRHTFASHAVMNNTPLIVVAKCLGHQDTRMVERYYGHLAPSYVAEEIRKGAPKFEIQHSNVRAIA